MRSFLRAWKTSRPFSSPHGTRRTHRHNHKPCTSESVVRMRATIDDVINEPVTSSPYRRLSRRTNPACFPKLLPRTANETPRIAFRTSFVLLAAHPLSIIFYRSLPVRTSLPIHSRTQNFLTLQPLSKRLCRGSGSVTIASSELRELLWMRRMETPRSCFDSVRCFNFNLDAVGRPRLSRFHVETFRIFDILNLTL